MLEIILNFCFFFLSVVFLHFFNFSNFLPLFPLNLFFPSLITNLHTSHNHSYNDYANQHFGLQSELKPNLQSQVLSVTTRRSKRKHLSDCIIVCSQRKKEKKNQVCANFEQNYSYYYSLIYLCCYS